MSVRAGALPTDLDQLTMLQACLQHGLEDAAVFEFFERELPPERGFLVAAGLEPVLAWLETPRFDDSGRAEVTLSPAARSKNGSWPTCSGRARPFAVAASARGRKPRRICRYSTAP